MDPPNLGHAYGVVQNWRSSHAMPLLVFRGHLAKRAEKVDTNPIIEQACARASHETLADAGFRRMSSDHVRHR